MIANVDRSVKATCTTPWVSSLDGFVNPSRLEAPYGSGLPTGRAVHLSTWQTSVRMAAS